MITEVNYMNLNNEVFSSNTVVVADFWAPWCGPCRMLSPIMEELASELGSKVKFVKINIDANPMIAQNFNISSIPTIMIFKDGQLKKRITGFVPKQQLVRTIKKI